MKVSKLPQAIKKDLGNGFELFVDAAGRDARGLYWIRAAIWNGKPLVVDVIAPDLALHRRRLACNAAKAAHQAGLDPAAIEAALIDFAESLASGGISFGNVSGATATGATAGAAQGNIYQETPGGLVWLKPTNSGDVPIGLTNFTAKIVADIALDDGQEELREFEIEAKLHGQVKRFSLPAGKSTGMSWPTEYLGASAIIAPGMGLRDHARAAIQWLSGKVAERRVYAHIGWRKLGPDWAYLHCGGAIGETGLVAGVEVRLADPLSRYCLPDAPLGDSLVGAIRASLQVLRLAPPRVTVPVLAGTYRAILGPVDFSLHLAGPTGVGKTEMAALAQQHYGHQMDARHLPGSWLSTGNSLEVLGFGAKDAVLVVDDFALTGSPQDVQRFHREADRLLRAQGNHAGRQRLNRDATLQMSKYPRGLLISTGEEVPRGQSLRARVLVLELSAGDLDWKVLTECQWVGADGLLAQAMAGFVRWLAPRYEGLISRLRKRAEELRDLAQASRHKRTPAIVAELGVGLECLVDYAKESQALSADEAERLWREGWEALLKAGELQRGRQGESEPAHRFLELVGSAIASGYAHLASPSGDDPADPVAWGWRAREVNTGLTSYTEWHPQGKRIGWIDGDEVYLEPNAAFAVAQELGHKMGESLAITCHTLRRRLKEQGLLAGWDSARETLTVRRKLEGRERDVLFFSVERLCTDKKTDIPDISDADAAILQGKDEDTGADTSSSGMPQNTTNVGNVGFHSGSESTEVRKNKELSAYPAEDSLKAENGQPVPEIDRGADVDLKCVLCGRPAFCLLVDGRPVCKDHAPDDEPWLPLPD